MVEDVTQRVSRACSFNCPSHAYTRKQYVCCPVNCFCQHSCSWTPKKDGKEATVLGRWAMLLFWWWPACVGLVEQTVLENSLAAAAERGGLEHRLGCQIAWIPILVLPPSVYATSVSRFLHLWGNLPYGVVRVLRSVTTSCRHYYCELKVSFSLLALNFKVELNNYIIDGTLINWCPSFQDTESWVT